MAKRLVAMLMAAALTLSLAACGNGGSSGSTAGNLGSLEEALIALSMISSASEPNLPLLTALRLIAAMPLPKQKI